jgi:prepilin-type N-terminal cleavage/methylation domain-containing protein
MGIRQSSLQAWLASSLRLRSQINRSDQGLTLVEVLVVIAVMAVLATISAPMWAERPLRQGTQQAGSLFRQVRMRAMSNTTAFRIRPDLSSVLPGTTRATRFLVQASTGKACGATTNILDTVPPTVVGSSSILPVNSVTGFNPTDRVTIGESTAAYEITAIDSANPQIIVGDTSPGSQGAALQGAEVELASVWRSGGQFTGLISDQLKLASSKKEVVTIPTTVAVSGQAVPWSLCYTAQGLASLYNARSGQVLNADLVLPIYSCTYNSNCTGDYQTGASNVRITRGGAVSSTY